MKRMIFGPRSLAALLLFAAIDHHASAAPAPAADTKKTFTFEQKGVQVTFTSDDPAFDPKERERLVATFFTVYPAMMAAFNPEAPKEVRLSVERKYQGVAATGGETIHLNPGWFRSHPEDIDVITHEGMHVVQQYRRGGPGWLTEGIADYARYKFGVNNAAAGWTLPDYNPQQHYDNSYRITARFLAWLDKHIKPGIVVALDGAMRSGTYSPGTWTQQTGKDVDELWAEYGQNPAL